MKKKRKRSFPPYGCLSAPGMRLKAVIRWEAEDSFASLQRWIANVRASSWGKPERAAYHLKKCPICMHAAITSPVVCYPKCVDRGGWGAGVHSASSAVLGTGRSTLCELNESSLEITGQRRALSTQTRWSTQLRCWLTICIFAVKVRRPRLRSLMSVTWWRAFSIPLNQ